jgi:hypothetical protein
MVLVGSGAFINRKPVVLKNRPPCHDLLNQHADSELQFGYDKCTDRDLPLGYEACRTIVEIKEDWDPVNP